MSTIILSFIGGFIAACVILPIAASVAFRVRDHVRSNRAFELGRDAYRQHRGVDSNPYMCPSPEWYRFREGFQHEQIGDQLG